VNALIAPLFPNHKHSQWPRFPAGRKNYQHTVNKVSSPTPSATLFPSDGRLHMATAGSCT